jgi:hypothetical protein
LQDRIEIELPATAKRTFPHGQNTPAPLAQSVHRPEIAFHISRNFRMPEIRAGCGQPKQMAPVTMPEAAVNEDDSSTTWKDEIRAARQIPSMETETEAARVKAPTQEQFRLRVGAADAAHI